MDPFNSLPPEIRLKVLFSITSKFSLSSIIRASPTMLQQYRMRRNRIRLNLISIDFDEEMVQNALAIIQFPTDRRAQGNGIWLVRPHLQRLLQQSFVFLHAARVPLFARSPITTSFNPDNLTKMELERFLRAFLLYELNCKVATTLGTSPNPRNPRNNLPQRPIRPSENEAIHCVHTYVRSLYGACIAQRRDGFLPTGPDGSQFEAGLVFPDNFCFDPDIYTGDMGLRGNFQGDVTSHLAKLGLETVAKFTGFRFGSSSENDSFDQQFDRLLTSQSYRMGPYQHAVTRVEPSDDAGSLMYQNISARLSRSNATQVQIYQQRAWVFFENTRLYLPRISAGPRFPCQNFLYQEADRPISSELGWIGNSEVRRGRARSQKWQDEYAKKKKNVALKDRLMELEAKVSNLEADLRQAKSGNPDLSVPVFEDPEFLREEAKRLMEQNTPCDIATVAKYVRWMPLDACIICRQPPSVVYIPAEFELFEGKTVPEIELALDFHLGMMKHRGELVPEAPISFCFGID
ncbi:hypothetical protein FPCIR_12753 [Fusarium pseudocircinatum]|uniref:Uncharacterized protein n=1 Tax=Fusarium pseudocircinatum TaxID=56676 RepID=A0A8H5KQI7_9HYPO|nr:hypothetical protein FPCIR_12753 [Fusarium pseudocircinatum]